MQSWRLSEDRDVSDVVEGTRVELVMRDRADFELRKARGIEVKRQRVFAPCLAKTEVSGRVIIYFLLLDLPSFVCEMTSLGR